MVRNSGGNKAKKFASKSFNMSDRITRYASEEGEVYGVVQRILGNNMCEVLVIDGSTKLCVIRGKFSGKGKRDNKIAKGTWVLVGIRSWEITTKDKQKCDLLEVYTDSDKEKLIKNSKENFRALLSVTNDFEDNDDIIKFVNQREDLLQNSEESEDSNLEDNLENPDDTNISLPQSNKDSNLIQQFNWIDIDDI